jgi:ADP-heptose:LPS heptosyltransferase
VGYGDSILGSGLASGFAARGKLAAFGNGVHIMWSDTDYEIFRNNPNVLWPGGESRGYKIEWIRSYVGNRPYGHLINGRWQFVDFQCPPGEIFLTKEEKAWAMARIWCAEPVIVIEPRVKRMGACDGRNKQWPVERYDALAAALRWDRGFHNVRVVQLVPPGKGPILKWAEPIETPSFRHALAALGLAALYIGPEGGLHHGAAAMGTNAVVIFGGFNTPRSTGYPWHTNITVGEPCGTNAYCPHCTKAMASISVETVYEAAQRQLRQNNAAQRHDRRALA